MEERLYALEQKLGMVPDAAYHPKKTNMDDETTKKNKTADPRNDDDNEATMMLLGERLQRLEERFAKLPGMTPSLQQLWKESDELMHQLDPGTALTHQQQIVAPLLYRKQQVLATSETFQQHLAWLAQIAQYLQVQPPTAETAAADAAGAATAATQQPQRSGSSSTSTITSTTDWTKTVANVPLLREAPLNSLSESEQERLKAVEETLRDVRNRTEQAAAKLDHLLNQYQTLVLAVSELLLTY